MKSIAREYKEKNIRKKFHIADDSNVSDVLEIPRLSMEIANVISGKHNQDVRLLTVGGQGKGKSMFELYLAYEVACRMAEKRGGEWNDYFSIDNVAIAKTQDVLELFGNMKKHNIYIADDVGLAWGARDYAKKVNKFMNVIFQLMRTRRNFIQVSIISNFLLDKVPRSLMNKYIEMDMSLFDYGLSFPKVFNVVQKPRKSTPFTIYPRYGNIKVVRYEGHLPPKDLIEEYNKRREAVEKEVRDEKIGELLTDENPETNGRSFKAKVIQALTMGIDNEQDIALLTGAKIASIRSAKSEWKKQCSISP